MEQRISLITLGVADVHRSRSFYERLGWQAQEIEETVFFQAGGTVALAQNVRTQAEVDAILADAATAGAEITQPPRETFYGGYAGHFRDPDGHVWEIAWNPGFTLNLDGSLTLPDFGAS
jgi:uncharacterized glyoxalase superfamily protein PhnB